MSTGRMPDPRAQRRGDRNGGSTAAQIGRPNARPIGAPPTSRRLLLWLSVGLIAADVAVYAPVRRHDFVYFDDQYYVTENPMVAAGLTWRGVVWAFTTGHAANWHPLTWLSHMLDVQLYGMHAGGHHLTNLVLHIVNTLLLFGVLQRMTGATGRSGFVAALFAVHPLHVESVAWVAERKDVLSTLFWMLTLWSYVSYVRQPRRGRYVLVIVLFALGLLAKPMLVTLPFVLLLLDYWPLGRVTLAGAAVADRGGPRASPPRTVWLHLLREKLPLFALAAASSVVTFVVQRQGRSVVGLDVVPVMFRAENVVVSYATYIGNMLWPVRLAAFYPFATSIAAWRVIGAAVLLAAACAAVLRAGRRRPYLLVGWLWYIGTLVPVIGLVQVGNQQMADRYTYVPLIGLFIIVAWGAADVLAGLPYGRIALTTAAAVVLAGCATAARGQVNTWANSVTLWQRAVDVTRDNFFAHRGLADQLAEQGQLDEAIAHSFEVVRLRPRWADAHLTLGNTLSRAGRIDEAAAEYSEALRLRPDFEEAHNGLGVVLIREGKHTEAIAHFVEAAHLKPEFADAHHNLALALAEQGRLDEAIPEMLKAVQIKSDDAPWHYDLATLYQLKGDTTKAAHQLETSLRLNPNDQTARRALEGLKQRGPRRAP
jgi:tetratricopeptide (TPR) repeat protein